MFFFFLFLPLPTTLEISFPAPSFPASRTIPPPIILGSRSLRADVSYLREVCPPPLTRPRLFKAELSYPPPPPSRQENSYPILEFFFFLTLKRLGKKEAFCVVAYTIH